MSQMETEEKYPLEDGVVVEQEPTATSSLEDRMKKKRSEVQSKKTEWFNLPGFEGVLKIEMKRVGYTTTSRVQKRNRKISPEALQELVNLADQMVLATVGFAEVNGTEQRPIQDGWEELARRMHDPENGVFCPEPLSPRRAILFLLGEERIPYLVQEWSEWAKTGAEEDDKEVVQDFVTTV